MDSKLILEAAPGTLDGTLSFPEVVGNHPFNFSLTHFKYFPAVKIS
jgi:hypothetical protein